MIKHFVLCCLALLCLSSCTVLQWRSSDEEITTAFAKAKIPTNISYIAIDSLDLNVRVQSIPLEDATINLVFLHGSPSSLSAWNGYLKDSTLYSQVAMHAVDRPGYGYSNFGDELVYIDTQGKVIIHIIN